MKKMSIRSFINIRTWAFLLTLIAGVSVATAQPIISGLDKTSGTVGEEVAISGLNLPFGGNERVRFGGAEVTTVVSSSINLIVVEVPPGAIYGPISVTDITSNLTGYSSEQFLLSFSGSNASFSGPTRFNDNGSNQPFDLTAADFDNDGDVDIVMTNEVGNKADLFTNDGTGMLTPTTINTTTLPTRNIDSGDLDGDGLPDLVMTRGNNANSIFIFDNTTVAADAIGFSAPMVINLPNVGENIRIARRPVIRDLDRDGKPEIIVSNESDNVIHVYVNESSGAGNFTFNATPIELTATGSTVGLSGLAAKDLNNDGFPEVVANAFINSPNLFVFRNTSSPGSINMLPATVITAPSGQVNLEVGDFDGDGFNDVASTSVTTDAVLFYRNTTTQAGAAITLADPISVGTGKDAPLGIALGDLNGDGKVDLAIGHEAGTDPQVVTLINTTTGTDFTFTPAGLSSEATSRNVKIADLNSDGRPDIAYANDIVTMALGDLGVFENTGCIEPTVTPNTDQVICTGTTLVLEATKTAPPMAYQWNVNGMPTGPATRTFSVPGAGAYSVTVTDVANGCSETSAVINVTIDPVANMIPNIVVANTMPCVGADLELTTPDVASGYFWTGPNGFTSTEQNPTISAIGPNQAGTYSLQLALGGSNCLSDVQTVDITVQNVPQPVVFNAGDANFCTGNTVQITTPEYPAGLGLSYSWNLGGTPITGETTTTLNVTAGGSYTAVISDGTCSLESPAETLTDVAPPSSTFTSADAICVNLPLAFSATSTGVTGFTLAYAWVDGAGGTSDLANPSFTYTAPGTFSASLTTSYVEVANCSDVEAKNITVQAVPTIPITAQSSVGDDLTAPFEKCPSDSVALSIAGLSGVAWMMMGETDTLASADTYSTSVIGDYTAMGTDAVGCVVVSNANLANFAGSGLTLTSSSTIDINDEIQLDEGQETVDFTVSGGMDYMWVPEELVDDPTGSMVIVTPFEVSTVVTVTGTDINDCVESRTVTILDTFVTPRTSFSPNGDGIGDCWEIPNLSTIPGLCSITVFDSRGRRLFEAASPFADDCVWDGFFSGNEVPEGVYYYAMSCENNDFDRSGSILLAR